MSPSILYLAKIDLNIFGTTVISFAKPFHNKKVIVVVLATPESDFTYRVCRDFLFYPDVLGIPSLYRKV
jgi:hypothetical protein